MIGKGVFLVFLLLSAFCNCGVIGNRKAWGSKLNLKEKNVQQFLKHNEVDTGMDDIEQVASGYIINEFGEAEDSESEDVEDRNDIRLQKEGTSKCLHPKTLRLISAGSFDFDEASCMMCECPSNKLKCYKTC